MKRKNSKRGKNSIQKYLFLLLLIAALITVTACASGDQATTEEPAGEEVPTEQLPTTLTIAVTRDEGSLTPYTYVSGYPGHNLLLMVYDTLFQLDANNMPQPWLVENFSSEDEGLTWTFTLRDGITWHDGQALTADDIRFSYTFYQQNSHSRWTNAVSAIEEISVEDALNFTITLNRPVPAFLTNPLADVPIIPEHIWSEVDDPDSFTDNTGSGPYMIIEHQPDQSYRMQAFQDYFAGEPKASEIRLVIIEDQTATFTALQVGDIDMAARNLLPELVTDFSASAETEVASGAGFVSTILQINNERAPFDNQLVRKAISRAIDIEDIVDTVMLGYATVGNPGYIHPTLPYYKTGLQHIYNPEQARSLLEEAGFAANYGDQSFELVVRSNDPIRVRTAEIIADYLSAVGINVTVQALDPSTVDSLVWPEFDTSMGRNYDLAIWGWSAPVMLDPARLGGLYHSDLSGRGTLNIGAYANPEMDDLIGILSLTVELNEQKQIHAEIQEIVAETVPFVTLFYPDGIYAYRPDSYNQWVFQNGQGILNKLSFVSGF